MGLKDRYNSSVSSAEPPAAAVTPERDLAALRAKLASGQTGGVNPPEAKDRMTDDMVAPQTPAASPVETASTPPASVTSATAPAPAETTKRGRKPAAVPAEPLSTEQIVEMLVSRGYAVNLERR